MNEVVLEIDLASGKGRCLYHEILDLRRFGKLTLRRASHVLFRRRTQDFMVRLAQGGTLGPFRSRAEAIAGEIAFIQKRMTTGDAPHGRRAFIAPARTKTTKGT